MSKILFACPHCSAQYHLDEALLGKKARCKRCRQSFHLTHDQGNPGAAPPSPAGEASAAARTGRGTEEDVALEWQPGDVIVDLYEVRGLLGEGGMGKVHRVHHREWDLDLAVKSPRPELLARPGAAEDFEREAETWVSLGLHPHAVSCFYVRRLGGVPRVFAECVEGGSLADWVRDGWLYEGGPARALARILDVAIQFAWGLHFAHEQGLVHQDVKPANVLMTPDGVAKVTDFGLARARAAAGEVVAPRPGHSVLVSTGGMTPAYCSPEQAGRLPLSRKTDLWSWAVSLLELFAGDVTWPSGTVAGEALEAYLEMGAGDDRLPPMPRGLAVLLRRCLTPDPAGRPQDMLEVVPALQTLYRQAAGAPHPREAPRAAEALADSLNNRAVSLLDLRKPENAADLMSKAEKLWEESLRSDPHHAESTYNLGLVRWRSGRLTGDDLIQRLQEVCASQPRQRQPLYLLAHVYLEHGECEEALATLGDIPAQEAGRPAVAALADLARKWQKRCTTPLQAFGGHKESISSVSLSRDGRYALAGSSGGRDKPSQLDLWEVTTGQCLHTVSLPVGEVESACLTADGRYALVGGANGLGLWEQATGRRLRTFEGHTKWVGAVCLSEDGRRALTGAGDGRLELWELATGRCLRTFQAGQAHQVTSVSLSQDARLALSGGADQTVRLWDVATGNCVRTLEGHRDSVRSVCLSGSGDRALSGGGSWQHMDYGVRLWETETGRCLRTFQGHKKDVTAVCLTGDGRYGLSASQNGAIKLWEVDTGRCLRTFEAGESTRAACLSRDGRFALSGGGYSIGQGAKNVKLWEVACDRDLAIAPLVVSYTRSSESTFTAATDYRRALSQAEEALARGDAVAAAALIRQARSQPGYQRKPEAVAQWVQLYMRLARERLLGGWEEAALEGHAGEVTSVQLSRDGRLALSGSCDKTLKLWDLGAGTCLRTFTGHTEYVQSVCLAGSMRWCLSGGIDRTVRLWDLETGRCLRTFEGHSSYVYAVCASADERFVLSGSGDRTLKLWELATGRCLRTFQGHALAVRSVFLTADGRWALSGGNDRTLRLWEIATGGCLRTFKGHTGTVNSVCVGPDGRFAVSGSGRLGAVTGIEESTRAANTLKAWDVATGECLRTFKAEIDSVNAVCLSPDGRHVLTGSGRRGAGEQVLQLWDLDTGQCTRTFEGHKGWVNAVCLSTDGSHALSGGSDKTVRLWALDWKLEDNPPADWDEGARPLLVSFLTLHTPCAAALPAGRDLTEAEVLSALTRKGRPSWTEKEFGELMHALGCAGYGWLRPEGVRRELEQMARSWQGPPSL